MRKACAAGAALQKGGRSKQLRYEEERRRCGARTFESGAIAARGR